MICLDTNVLLRFLVRDDPVQSAQAAALIERLIRDQTDIYLCDITLCEVVWVLNSGYKLKRASISKTMWLMYRASHFRFEDRGRLYRALVAYEAGSGDFADYLIREQALAVGCSGIFTFDKVLLKEEGFDKVE